MSRTVNWQALAWQEQLSYMTGQLDDEKKKNQVQSFSKSVS